MKDFNCNYKILFFIYFNKKKLCDGREIQIFTV